MKSMKFDDIPTSKQWDSSKEQFFKVVTTVSQGALRMYEGGYLTFDASGEREESRTRWLHHLNIRIGVRSELPYDIVETLATPDGEPVKMADLSQGDQQILLCDLDHRIAVKLNGYWRGSVKCRSNVYWPSATARPISNSSIVVSRADRKTSSAMKKRLKEAADTLDAALQVMQVERTFVSQYAVQSLRQTCEAVAGGKLTPEQVLESCNGNTKRMNDLVAALTYADVSAMSRSVSVVEYLKF